MGISEWAADKPRNGEGPVSEWFRLHPEAAEEARRGPALKLSRPQILAYLQEAHGYPFKDDGTMARALGL